jgi:hypothetical protein
MASSRVTHRTAWQVFRAPLLVGIVASAGLAFALFGDGIWDGLSWLALSVPVLLSLISWMKAAHSRAERAEPQSPRVHEWPSQEPVDSRTR